MGVGRLAVVLLAAALLCAGAGCQVAQPVSTTLILRQQALLDFTGLLPTQQIRELKVNWAVPREWEALPMKRGLVFTHQQYRSPSGVTGVGVAYIRLPFVLPAGAVGWLAQREYTKRHGDQQEATVLSNWSDEAGREWFEAVNDRYHGTGYIMTRGNEAWIVYSGHRMKHTPMPEEISVAFRSAHTIVPITGN